jgi:hypothetical protein
MIVAEVNRKNENHIKEGYSVCVSTARYTTPYPPTPRTSTSSKAPPSMSVPRGGWVEEITSNGTHQLPHAEVFHFLLPRQGTAATRT